MTRASPGALPMRGGVYASGPTGWRSGPSYNQDYRDAVAALNPQPDVYIPFGPGDPVDEKGYATFTGYVESSPVGSWSYSSNALIENDDYGVLGDLTSGSVYANFSLPTATSSRVVYAYWVSVDAGFNNFFPVSGSNWTLGYQSSTGETVLQFDVGQFRTLTETWPTGRHLIAFGRNYNNVYVWRDGSVIMNIPTGVSATSTVLKIALHANNPGFRIDEAMMWNHFGGVVNMFTGSFFDDIYDIGRGI